MVLKVSDFTSSNELRLFYRDGKYLEVLGLEHMTNFYLERLSCRLTSFLLVGGLKTTIIQVCTVSHEKWDLISKSDIMFGEKMYLLKFWVHLAITAVNNFLRSRLINSRENWKSPIEDSFLQHIPQFLFKSAHHSTAHEMYCKKVLFLNFVNNFLWVNLHSEMTKHTTQITFSERVPIDLKAKSRYAILC